MFTTQHYYLISRLLREHFPYDNYNKLIYDFCKMLSDDNKKFDEDKFREASKPKMGGK